MTETIKLDGIDRVEAEHQIKQVYIDRYGAENIRSYKALGDPVIKAKGYDDETKVVGYENGKAIVDVTKTSQTTRSIIGQISDGPNEYGRSVVERGVEQYEEEMEEGTSPSSSETRSEPVVPGAISDFDVEEFGDGSLRFKPRFTQKEASYLEPGDRSYDENHKVCEECAHYIEGGGCHIVEAPISEDGYCEEFYADVGLFAHKHDDGIEENLSMWGHSFDWTISDAKEFAMDVRERIEAKVRGER